MINIIDAIQNAINFLVSIVDLMTGAIGHIIDYFQLMGDALDKIVSTVPPFMSSFVIIIFFFCGLAIIIKLLPFIG